MFFLMNELVIFVWTKIFNNNPFTLVLIKQWVTFLILHTYFQYTNSLKKNSFNFIHCFFLFGYWKKINVDYLFYFEQ